MHSGPAEQLCRGDKVEPCLLNGCDDIHRNPW
jgi:hypothetical protein